MHRSNYTYGIISLRFVIEHESFDGLQFEKSRQIVENGAQDGTGYESAVEVDPSEGICDGHKSLDRHGQSHQDRSNATDVSEAVPKI